MNLDVSNSKKIFRKEKDDKVYYSIGLSKKDKDGNYIYGYMMCRFPKDASIPDKAKILIKEAWIDFYLKDKITNPYIFINKYEIVEDGKTITEELPKASSEYDTENSDVQIKDEDLPF